MNPDEIARTIRSLGTDVSYVSVNGDMFFFAGDAPDDQRMPFATIVSSDAHDRASDLNREGVFRLNIGVSRQTYIAMFGAPPSGPLTAEPVDTGFDYTHLDEVMPHPIYASLSYICVLNPSDQTFEAVRSHLEEAHNIAAGRRSRRVERTLRKPYRPRHQPDSDRSD